MLLATVTFLAAAQSIGPTIGDRFGHGGGGPDQAVLTILPPKLAKCRTDAEIRKALAEQAQGELQSCDPPRSARRAQRR